MHEVDTWTMNTLSYATLALDEPAEHVLRVRLNRPDFANALNTQMGLDVLDLTHRIGAAPQRYRCIIHERPQRRRRSVQ